MAHADHSRAPAGFTLVELLVVVSIIVILLTIAVPAFDRAIYQSKLTVCAANLSAVVKGATGYSVENKNRYPHRAAATNDWSFVTILSRDAGNKGNALDDRPRLRSHIPLDALVDPLCGDIDLDDTHLANGVANIGYTGVGGTETGTEVLLGNVALMFSIPFVSKGSVMLSKSTDRRTIDGNPLTVLAADYDAISKQKWYERWANSSHADSEGRLQFQKFYNQGNLMWSEWARVNIDNLFPSPPRGPCDFNYGYKDGAVRRVQEVKWDDHRPENGSRMVRVPRNYNNWNNDEAVDYLQLPKEY